MCGYVSLLVPLVLRNKTKNHKKAAKKKELLSFILYAAFPFPVVSYAFSLRLYPLKKTLKKKGKHTKEKITTLFPSKPSFHGFF